MAGRRSRLAERRRLVGLSQEGLAERLGADRSTVARWERGETTPQPWHRPRLAEALEVSVEDVDLLLAGAEDVPAAAGQVSELDEAPGHTPFPDHEARTAYLPAARGQVFASALQSFRVADRQVGGGHLYATVVGYLHRDVAPHLFRASGASDMGGGTFTAAAALTEMAGWMAHDAGGAEAARQHFVRAYDLARLGPDSQLSAHVLGSLSHLAHHQTKPDEAISLARRGRSGLSGGQRQPELEARLLALEARGLATQGQARACVQLLGQAERTLASTPDEPPSPWVSRFDEAALANETARSLRRLGDLDGAGNQAKRVLALRPHDRPRSRAFGQLILVAVLLAQGRLEEACMVVDEVITATRHLGSYLVVRQLLSIRQRLAPHRAQAAVSAFLDSMDEALQERRWLHPEDEHRQPAAAVERR